MVYESWAPYVNPLYKDYVFGKHTCQQWENKKGKLWCWGAERERPLLPISTLKEYSVISKLNVYDSDAVEYRRK